MNRLTEQQLDTLEAAVEKMTPAPFESPLKDLGDAYFDHTYEAYPPLGESGPVIVTGDPDNMAALVSLRNHATALIATAKTAGKQAEVIEAARKSVEELKTQLATVMTEFEAAVKNAETRETFLRDQLAVGDQMSTTLRSRLERAEKVVDTGKAFLRFMPYLPNISEREYDRLDAARTVYNAALTALDTSPLPVDQRDVAVTALKNLVMILRDMNNDDFAEAMGDNEIRTVIESEEFKEARAALTALDLSRWREAES